MLKLAAILLLALLPARAADAVRLIVRGDDVGMTQGSIDAAERALNHGVMTCASLLVPAPWFEAAAEMVKRNPGWCMGVHLTLVGEWRGYRWRPVSPPDKVRSLVDADGYLYQHPSVLFRHKPKIEEIEMELRAQIALATKRGVNLRYIDTHYMDLDAYPGLEPVVRAIARELNVPISETLGETKIDVYSTPPRDKLKTMLDKLDQLKPGLYVWVCHAGTDSPEQHALIHTAPGDIFVEGVGTHRAEELRVITSPLVKAMILKKGIALAAYGDPGLR